MNTDIFSHINWLAVLVGGIGYFLLGAIWYSLLFRTAWLQATGINANDPGMRKGAGGIMFTSFILMLIASLGIGILLSRLALTGGWMSGAKLGLIVGICFSATATSISYLYEKRPFSLHLINGLYNILGCVIAGIIQSVWPW
jgi:hypothetical protein